MGLPSGVRWSPYNVDVTKSNGFTDGEFHYDCSFFSWGNVDGHNPTAANSFAPWSWGGINGQAPWYDGTVYGGTPGSELVGNLPLTHDAAAINCGNGWRLPTSTEFEELLEYSVFIDGSGVEIPSDRADKRITLNGIVGIYLKSTVNGNRLFIPAVGLGADTHQSSRGQYGYYWTSSPFDVKQSICFFFSGSQINPISKVDRYYGFTVRPVKDS